MKTHIGSAQRTESEISVLVGGLATVFFGFTSVVTAIGLGWAAAAVLGVVMLVLAWKVPVRESAQVLSYILAGLGVMSLLGAVFDLLT